MQEVENIYGGTNLPVVGRSTTTEMVVSRQAQEVQAAIVIAKKFPRNEYESFSRVMKACQRKGLAEKSMYEYPRGGDRVTGPSIRLAEAIAQSWGNIDFGIIELEQKDGESQVMTYAWDLETNTRQTKIFSVPHIRTSKKSGNVRLTDPRDIYEKVANDGARRLRACILGVIPGDVVESAVVQCEKTLIGDNKEPLGDTIRAIVGTFEREYGVTVVMLEKFIGCKIESFTMQNLIRLKKVHLSLKDGMAKRGDYFEMLPSAEEAGVTDPFGGKREGAEKAQGRVKKGSGIKEELAGVEQTKANPTSMPPEGLPEETLK